MVLSPCFRVIHTPSYWSMGFFHRMGTGAADPEQGAPARREVDSRIKTLETAVEALQGRLRTTETGAHDLARDGHETRLELAELEKRIGDLVFAVSEGISKVERAEARIRATVRRARAELEDGGTYSPALDAEAAELHLVDGGGSEDEPVQPLRDPVAAPGLDVRDLPGDWLPEDVALLGGD